jgi:hypothetical protein
MMHVPFDRQLMVENDQCAILAPYYRESFAAACGPEQHDCDVPAPEYRGRRLSAAVATIPDISAFQLWRDVAIQRHPFQHRP